MDRLAWKVFIGAGLLAVFSGLDWLLGGGVATTTESEDYATRFWRLRSQVGRRVFLVTAPVAAASFLTWFVGRAF